MRLPSKPTLFACLHSAALLLCFAIVPLSAQTKLLRFPDIHDNRIVFTYGGDLWLVHVAGGSATRLTSHTLHQFTRHNYPLPVLERSLWTLSFLVG
jgi:tricorn protease-like protein